MLIGYARVSTNGQNLDRQTASLKAAGVGRIYCDKASGKSLRGRPELERAIAALGAGDTIVLAEWDRATRSMFDGVKIIERIAERGAMVKALDKPWLDLTTPIGQGILAFLSALGEDERLRILKRAREGRVEAKKRGVKFGRKSKLTPHQRQQALRMVAEGQRLQDIADLFGIHKSNISRLRGKRGS